jgi:hypothetical protein
MKDNGSEILDRAIEQAKAPGEDAFDELLEFANTLKSKQQPLPPAFDEIRGRCFWELI